jgi:hypothetical protein
MSISSQDTRLQARITNISELRSTQPRKKTSTSIGCRGLRAQGLKRMMIWTLTIRRIGLSR